MHATEPDDLVELIDDCADIPASLRPGGPRVPLSRLAPAWEIDDRCAAQSGDEGYGCRTRLPQQAAHPAS